MKASGEGFCGAFPIMLGYSISPRRPAERYNRTEVRCWSLNSSGELAVRDEARFGGAACVEHAELVRGTRASSGFRCCSLSESDTGASFGSSENHWMS
jgi:hypothetical protein